MTRKEPSCACLVGEVSLTSGVIILSLCSAPASNLVLGASRENRASVSLQLTSTSCPAQEPFYLLPHSCCPYSWWPAEDLQPLIHRKLGFFSSLAPKCSLYSLKCIIFPIIYPLVLYFSNYSLLPLLCMLRVAILFYPQEMSGFLTMTPGR